MWCTGASLFSMLYIYIWSHISIAAGTHIWFLIAVNVDPLFNSMQTYHENVCLWRYQNTTCASCFVIFKFWDLAPWINVKCFFLAFLPSDLKKAPYSSCVAISQFFKSPYFDPFHESTPGHSDGVTRCINQCWISLILLIPSWSC